MGQSHQKGTSLAQTIPQCKSWLLYLPDVHQACSMASCGPASHICIKGWWKKKNKRGGETSPVVQWLRFHLPLKKAQVRSHIPTMWRIMMLCGEPYEFTQHLPGACRGGEKRPVGKQDYIFSPFLIFSVKVSWKKWPQGWGPHGQRRVG